MKKVYEIVFEEKVIDIVGTEECAKAFCDKMNTAFKLDVRRREDLYYYIEQQLDEEPKAIISFVVGFLEGSLIDPCIQTFDDHRFHLGEITILPDGTFNVCFSMSSDETITKERIIEKAKELLLKRK